MHALSKTLAVAAFAAIGGLAVEHATAVPPAPSARPGQAAPSFSAPHIARKTVRLRDYCGKIVGLEWNKHGRPFVGKPHRHRHIQALPPEKTAGGGHRV